MRTHTLCDLLTNLLAGSHSQQIDAGVARQQRIVGNCGEANESHPDGLLLGIATHL